MIRRMMMAALLASGVAGPVCAGQSAPITAEPTKAEALAKELQRMVGMTASGDLQVTEVKAEKDVLVVTIDARSGWAGRSMVSIRDGFVTGMCANPAKATDFFATSWVRVDTLERGANLKHGDPTNVCPPAAKS